MSNFHKQKFGTKCHKMLDAGLWILYEIRNFSVFIQHPVSTITLNQTTESGYPHLVG